MPDATPGPDEAQEHTLTCDDELAPGHFIQTPSEFIRWGDRSPEYKLLYQVLMSRVGQGAKVMPSQATLAADMGVRSEDTVRVSMRKLAEDGLLSYKQRGQGRTNLYHVHALDMRTGRPKPANRRTSPPWIEPDDIAEWRRCAAEGIQFKPNQKPKISGSRNPVNPVLEPDETCSLDLDIPGSRNPGNRDKIYKAPPSSEIDKGEIERVPPFPPVGGTPHRSTSKPARQFGPGEVLYREAFYVKLARYPAASGMERSTPSRMEAIYAEVGELRFVAALKAYFSCLYETDFYPKTRGFDAELFVRQFAKWEGGAGHGSGTTAAGTRSKFASAASTLQ